MTRNVRTPIAALLLSLPLAAAAAGGPPGGAPAELSPVDRAVLAARIHALVSLHFAHFEAVPELDLDASLREYVAEALAAPDRRGFALATFAYLARLRNGHTDFEDAGLGDWGRPLGLGVRRVAGRWTVVASAVEGLRRGDVLAAIDGEPVDRFYARQRRYLTASSDVAAERSLFSTPLLFPLSFRLGLEDGRELVIDRVKQPLRAPEPRRVQARWLERGKVAYVAIPSFGDPAYEEEALRHVDELATAPVLVVDVRGNGGGNTPSRLLARLMDRPWRSRSYSTQVHVGLAAAYATLASWPELPAEFRSQLEAYGSFAAPQLWWPGERAAPAAGAYAGQLVILADGGCASACEDFVGPFKDNGRATIVGEPTFGSSGQPFLAKLQGGMTLRVGAKRERMPDGSPFEGVGVLPDVAASPDVRDLRTGRDVVLERAVALAKAPRR